MSVLIASIDHFDLVFLIDTLLIQESCFIQFHYQSILKYIKIAEATHKMIYNVAVRPMQM